MNENETQFTVHCRSLLFSAIFETNNSVITSSCGLMMDIIIIDFARCAIKYALF